MTTDGAKRLRLQSWFSPAFPIGAFSYSHGLEWAVEEGSVTDRGSLVAWLEADLRHGSGLMDAMFFAQAWRAAQAASPSPGMLTQSALSRQGKGQSAGVANGVAISGVGDGGNEWIAASSSPLPRREPLKRTTSVRLRERAATQSPGEGEPTAMLMDGARNRTALEHFPAEPLPAKAGMTPVCVAKMQPNKETEPHSDPIGTERALVPPNREPALADRGDILAIAELAAAMRGTSELALESGQQGIAFLGAVRKAWPHPELDRLTALLPHAAIAPVLPVAAGICCAVHEIGLELALPAYVHGSAANLVNAAVRLVPLGQTDGQIAVAALEASVLETAREALGATLEDIGSAAFMVDLASMLHETQYTRLFRS